LIPVDILFQATSKIKEEFPECEIFIGGGMDFGMTITVEIPGHDGLYRLRYEFTAAQLELALDQEILLETTADRIIAELKEKDFIKGA